MTDIVFICFYNLIKIQNVGEWILVGVMFCNTRTWKTMSADGVQQIEGIIAMYEPHSEMDHYLNG